MTWLALFNPPSNVCETPVKPSDLGSVLAPPFPQYPARIGGTIKMSPSKFGVSSGIAVILIVLLLRCVAFTGLVCKRQSVVYFGSVLCKISLNVFFFFFLIKHCCVTILFHVVDFFFICLLELLLWSLFQQEQLQKVNLILIKYITSVKLSCWLNHLEIVKGIPHEINVSK